MLTCMQNRLKCLGAMIRCLVVVLALGSQVAAGAVAAPEASGGAAAALDAAMVFCQAGPAPRGDTGPPRHHHVTDPALVQAAQAAVQLVAILDAGPRPAPPRSVPGTRTRLPAARAPPARVIAAAFPRGPPGLSG